MNSRFVTLVSELADLGLDGKQIAAAVRVADGAANDMASQMFEERSRLADLHAELENAKNRRPRAHRAAPKAPRKPRADKGVPRARKAASNGEQASATE